MSSISRHYDRLAALWPKDLLRPHRPFGAALLHRRAALSPSSTANSDPSSSASRSAPAPNASDDQSSALSKPAVRLDEAAEMRNVNALYALLEDRYKKRYPLSGSLLTPASRPTYYEDLMRDLDESPNRTWVQRMMINFKAFFRWRR